MEKRDPQLLLPQLVKTCASNGTDVTFQFTSHPGIMTLMSITQVIQIIRIDPIRF
jgi:hypothetical protein